MLSRLVPLIVLFSFVATSGAQTQPSSGGIPPLLNQPFKAIPKFPAAPDQYHWDFWWKDMGVGKERELWQVLLPNGKSLNKCRKYLAEQYLKDHWNDIASSEKSSNKFKGVTFGANDLAVAIAGIENMSSLPDSLYNIVGEKDTMGITLSTYGDPISYLSQSELDSNPEAENIDTIDHEAIHQAFSAEGMTEGGDSAEEAWIQSYLEKHPLTDYLKTHHCPD